MVGLSLEDLREIVSVLRHYLRQHLNIVLNHIFVEHVQVSSADDLEDRHLLYCQVLVSKYFFVLLDGFVLWMEML